VPLSNISTCQSSPNTTSFCWPLNNTRICLPGDALISLYWSPSFYDSSAKLALDYNLVYPTASFSNNTGNKTIYVGQYIYDNYAKKIDGKENERSLKLWMREKKDASAKVDTFDGPTIILVKTAAFTTITAGRPSGTRSAKSGHDHDDEDAKFKGVIAGIVMGVLVGITLLVTCCAWGCGCCCFGKRKGNDRDMQSKIVEQGAELMGQRSGGAGRVGSGSEQMAHEGLTRGQGRRESLSEDPPPKYVP
jgi:hypothetical protein